MINNADVEEILRKSRPGVRDASRFNQDDPGLWFLDIFRKHKMEKVK